MPFSIQTRDGIKINNIPDNLNPNSPEVMQRVGNARKQLFAERFKDDADLVARVNALSGDEVMQKIELSKSRRTQAKGRELSPVDLLGLQLGTERQTGAVLTPQQAQQVSQAPVNQPAIEFEKLQQQNPVLAEIIQDLNPLERAAIGFQGGLRTVGRGAGKAVGADFFPDNKIIDPLLSSSTAAKFGKFVGEAAPFAVAGPLTGSVGRGLTASRGGATLVPEITSTAARAGITSGLSAAEGAAIAAGQDKSASEVAGNAVLGGAIGLGAELGLSRLAGSRNVLPGQLVEEGEELLRRSASPRDVNRALEEAAPSIDQLRDASRNIFNDVADLGVQIDPRFYDEFADRTIREATQELGLSLNRAGQTLTPQSRAIVDLIDDIRGGPVGVDNMDQIRRAAQNAAGTAARAGNNNDAAIANLIIDRIDGLMASINPSALTGNTGSVGAQLRTARNLWGRARRAELLDEAIDSAEIQKSGVENGIRTKFGQIINNKRKSRFFTRDEISAMRDVVSGSTGANFFKRLGKLGFGSGQQTNVLSGLTSSLAGSVTMQSLFGPLGAAVGAVLMPTVGTISKPLAERLTRRNATLANRVVRAGNDAERITRAYLSAVPPAERSAEDLSQLLMRPGVNLDTAGSEIAIEAATLARQQRQQLSAAPLGAAPGVAAASAETEQAE